MEVAKDHMEKSALSIDLDVDAPYERAVELVKAALQDQGFGVLTEVDVQATMREKLDAHFQPYIILGACNPALAYKALSADLGVGLMLPCNVIVYEVEAAKSRVQIMDPVSTLALVQNDALVSVASEARVRLEKVAATLREADELTRRSL